MARLTAGTRTVAGTRTTAGDRLKVRDFGTALNFGVVNSDQVAIENSANQVWAGNTDITVSLWMKVSLFGDFYAFAHPDGAGANRTYILIDSSKRLLTNVGSVGSTTAGLLRTGKWYNVVLVKDRANSLYSIWLDGVNIVTPTAYTPGTAAAIDIFIGNQSSGGAKAWKGVIDETRMWNRVLTSTEILNLYYTGVAPTDGLIGEWLFNEGSGTTAIDSSGNGNDGVITGATYTTDVVSTSRTNV